MIQVNDKIRITRLDDKNLQLEEYRLVINNRTKAERYDWVWVGYYSSLEGAMKGVLKHCSMALVDEEFKGCEKVIERLNSIETEITKAIKERGCLCHKI